MICAFIVVHFSMITHHKADLEQVHSFCTVVSIDLTTLKMPCFSSSVSFRMWPSTSRIFPWSVTEAFFWKRLYEMLLVNCFIQNFFCITFLQELVIWYLWNVYNAKSLFWIKTSWKTSKGSFRYAFLDI